jgi:hypothetical protein
MTTIIHTHRIIRHDNPPFLSCPDRILAMSVAEFIELPEEPEWLKEEFLNVPILPEPEEE